MKSFRNVVRMLVVSAVSIVAVPASAATVYTASLVSPPGYSAVVATGVESPNIVGSGIHGGGFSHALLYDYATNTAEDLNPAGFQFSVATGVSGDFQAGYARDDSTPTSVTHAFLWNGTAASAVDLNPAGFAQSTAFGISGNSQVGVASSPSLGHAMLWHGTAASAVDLHTAAFNSSFAQRVWGDTQVGWADMAGVPTSEIRAMLWNGTAASVVNLHPTSGTYRHTQAMGAANGSQVGFGVVDGVGDHALLWTGSADSVVDLHPAGMTVSQALAASGDVQVGYGQVTNFLASQRAVAWNGTAASAVDLHQFLTDLDFSALFPGETITLHESQATGVDANGVIVGYLRFDTTNSLGFQIGVRWTPIPEPGSMLLLTIAATAMGRTRAGLRRVAPR